MSNLQKYFNQFHETIKLDTENSDLRTSRDAIKSKLGTSLKEYFENKQIAAPSFFDQGSYAMGTGVKPADSEGSYDIDEGVKFDINTNDFPDPVEIKKSIKEALSGHTELGVHIKGPCVRVIYSENKEEKYHVDLAIYATNGQTARGSVLRLARGKEFSSDEYKYWEESQPESLIDLIDSKFLDKDQKAQFHRVIRYLKRWKDLRFSSIGNSAPRGIALTVLAYQYFSPSFYPDGSPSDLDALINFIYQVKGCVQNVFFNDEFTDRIVCKLPVRPNNDLFGLMTNNQMTRFLGKIDDLYGNLTTAKSQSLDDDACLTLSQVFGDDFPSPDVSKAFSSVRKPNIGYFPPPDFVNGYDQAPIDIAINGFLYVREKAVPIPSNKRVFGTDNLLEFRALSRVAGKQVEYFWRVVNTGKHVTQVAKTLTNVTETFRGNLYKARLIKKINGRLEAIPSKNELLNQEGTAYSGRHWIECLALKNGVCIGRSKPFYVNIYNPTFPNYD